MQEFGLQILANAGTKFRLQGFLRSEGFVIPTYTMQTLGLQILANEGTRFI